MTHGPSTPGWSGRLFGRREPPDWVYHVLLLCLLLAFLLIPVVDRAALGGLMVRAIFAAITWGVLLMVGHRPVLLAAGLVLAFPSPVVRLLGVGGPAAEIAADGAQVALAVFVIFVLMSRLLQHRRITPATVSGVTSIYLLIGVAWTMLYLLLEGLQPCSFNGVPCTAGALGAFQPPPRATGLLFYYSLVTLSTLGYGDITPATDPARAAAAMEAVVGQLFLVIVLARIVGLMVAPGERDSTSG